MRINTALHLMSEWQVDIHILQLEQRVNNCNVTMQTEYVCKEPKLFVGRTLQACMSTETNRKQRQRDKDQIGISD